MSVIQCIKARTSHHSIHKLPFGITMQYNKTAPMNFIYTLIGVSYMLSHLSVQTPCYTC